VCPLLVSHCTNCASLVSRWPHYWLSSYPILSLIWGASQKFLD